MRMKKKKKKKKKMMMIIKVELKYKCPTPPITVSRFGVIRIFVCQKDNGLSLFFSNSYSFESSPVSEIP
jgi:hypothetical protein